MQPTNETKFFEAAMAVKKIEKLRRKKINIKIMKRKQLESFLHQLDTFEKPLLELEQYATSAELATSILKAINEDIGLDESTVLGDLGCGCGVLMLGAAKLGAGFCIGYDIDDGALSICRQNSDDADLGDVCDLVQVDLMSASTSNSLSRFYNSFDIIVTNPPFGTKGNSGTDLKFIELGLALLKPGGHLYSLHKTATRRFLLRKSQNDWKHMCSSAECIAELQWNLEKTYSHQKHHNGLDIAVDLFRFIKVL
ncbi:methyltransferase small domain-containing protein [Ditylenchus destructor]|nr:methyltransferase small domain-containing protein [Ditylenchus destructor]